MGLKEALLMKYCVEAFGAYDIAGCDKLSMEEKQKRNRIYDEYIR